ncbi:Nucleoside diphosphate kinase [Listeria fleischmannii subsp. fleischmannii]|uniref:nucleoside-diphosphate kinase n=1 Tax=Listeria fleischmannii subsp. fleischmannii TaxID=1671902 RepID=A0A2X3HES3_9LIST|nr:Nucleoside diphosphate kinase [Listeria fleischmannii subsp. fleischmannii]
MEKTFVMVKPDGVQRGLIGQLISRFEQKGLRIKAAKLMQISDSLAKTHYAEHDGKPFFPDLIHFITSGPVFAMVLEGDEAITTARQMMGKTNPSKLFLGRFVLISACTPIGILSTDQIARHLPNEKSGSFLKKKNCLIMKKLRILGFK